LHHFKQTSTIITQLCVYITCTVVIFCQVYKVKVFHRLVTVVLVRPLGTLVPKAFCFSRDVF